VSTSSFVTQGDAGSLDPFVSARAAAIRQAAVSISTLPVRRYRESGERRRS
jgi:hypothetical protein